MYMAQKDKDQEESWEVVDIMVKEAIDSSGVFNTILLSRIKTIRSLTVNLQLHHQAWHLNSSCLFNPPIMFREGIDDYVSRSL